MSNIGLYAKAVGGALAAAGTAAITALSDGHINTLEWVTIIGAFVAGLGAIAAVPEFPINIAKYFKAITSGLVGGLASLSAVLVSGHGFTQMDWINIAIAVIVGTGLVHVTKNASESETMHQATTPVPVPSGMSGDVVEEDEIPEPDEDEPVEPVEDDFVVDTDEDSTTDAEVPLETK